jgi:hypothetical protein
VADAAAVDVDLDLVTNPIRFFMAGLFFGCEMCHFNILAESTYSEPNRIRLGSASAV